jgi:hypothetical protein
MENSWEEYRYEVTECMLLHISHPQITCCSYQIDDANGDFEVAQARELTILLVILP